MRIIDDRHPRRGVCAFLTVVFSTLLLASANAASAAEPTNSSAPIRVIIELPNDDSGRALVNRIVPGNQEPAQPIAVSQEAAPASIATSLQDLRQRLLTLVDAVPTLPGQIQSAIRVFQTDDRIEPVGLILAVILFVAGGFVAQRLAWWSGRGLLHFVLNAPADTVRQRIKLHAARLSMGLLALVGYLIGSLGAFILFPWPAVFRDIALILLSAALMVRLGVLVGRIVIAPGARLPHMRLLTLVTSLAWFWYYWLLGIVAVLAAGWGTIEVIGTIGASPILADLFTAAWLGVVSIALIVMIWLRHFRSDGPPVSRLVCVGFSASILLSWLLWVSGLRGAFWTVVVITLLPLTVSVAHDIIRRIIQSGDQQAVEDPAIVGWSVVIMQTLRNGLIVVAALLIARAWNVNLSDLAAAETVTTRLIRAGIRIVIVLLVTDVIWKLASTLIDSQMAVASRSEQGGHHDGPDARRRQRLNTLLPILRNVLFLAIGAVGFLMILDAVGIQIGPLLAGAGVVGIAVGFGAQTLVKDIISGVFYLFDDAFRIGEYIQAAKYKGTVEGFSLRSIRLRHHRGPVTIVPFGELGAVQNLSRDWVIDIITLTLNYDSDLEEVRKTIKRIGVELLEDAELGPNIIEPLKMQGIEQMADYGVQIRLKFMTKPGEQFGVRRKALAMLKKTFAEKGIQFATPTVHVSGGPADAAATAAASELQRPPKVIPTLEE
ncbi:mechanosensitive ion channel domain-containing protein [Rhizobium ruizarguesonis]|jgi:small-conductance mechanosensitive channel|uniref:mechanosensitive ion channel domain-containing protein n=1 Tax=Rhizobium ruizarguesonis TaxID=2081791 RepID=UPI0010301013|nr:mechanosensitive ion channel domain-containing protein [Rhizobium ruizarguesonis]MBC2803859.1 mechanosensitive ion channel family protein [Rhizobium ruizarguesonis]NKQ70487.1 mechanosensitive ion channel protein [Rhizobium ruizarguesonis]TAU26752.1 mechanosensitive ion channel family protein [Rhizobium ruizarguesonis]TAU68404.1 mechanosensitive ion channel family protein [Rhizobium ruizarguesonis]TAV15853.1 mechanosensitive ion channel family protein [Rhizobium ruizarguesonis]